MELWIFFNAYNCYSACQTNALHAVHKWIKKNRNVNRKINRKTNRKINRKIMDKEGGRD
jgi:hypothetical protein